MLCKKRVICGNVGFFMTQIGSLSYVDATTIKNVSASITLTFCLNRRGRGV